MNKNIVIPHSEYTFTFSRSSGAGGQNVNKVNSRVTMSWDIEASVCNDSIKKRFKEKYKNLITSNLVVIHSQKHRSQKMNIEDCINKLAKLLSTVQTAPKMRIKTKATRSSSQRRLDSKSKHSKLKKLRSEKY